MVIERIYCGVQNYAWGKRGSNSTVAKLAAHSAKDFRYIDKNLQTRLKLKDIIKSFLFQC